MALALTKKEGYNIEVRPVLVDEIVEAAENGTLKEIFGAGTAAVINQIEAFSYKDKMYELPNMDNEGSYALDLKDKLTKIQNKLADDSFGWTVKI